MIQRHNIFPSSAEIQLILSNPGCPNLNDLAENEKDLSPKSGSKVHNAILQYELITNMPVF